MMRKEQEATWIKYGDFKNYTNFHVARNVEYQNKPLGAEIRIQGCKKQFLNSREITELRVIVFCNNNDTLDAIYNTTLKANLSGTYEIEHSNTIASKAFFTLPVEKKQELVSIFRIIGKYLPIKTIIKGILDSLDLKAIPNEKEFYDNLEMLIKNNKVQEAIQQALVIEEDEQVLWNLIDLLEKNEKFVETLEVCQLIPQENVNYCKANEKAEQIILRYEQSNPSLTHGEVRSYLEAKIRFMLRSNNSETQPVLDQRFNEFCGDTSLNPVLKDVKADEDTVVSLGNTINTLKKEILVLQKQNQELLTKLEKLTTEHDKVSQTEKQCQMRAASTIQFWYRRTRDKNNESSRIQHKNNNLSM